jgi:hypothetical protein
LPEFDVTILTFGDHLNRSAKTAEGPCSQQREANVIQRAKIISNAIVVAATAAVLLPAPLALAADAREVDELKGEIRQLQVQVQALRSAMAELSELDRQEYYLVSRAPGSIGATSESAPAPAPALATAEPREPTPARVSTDTSERPSRASKSRHHRHSSSRSRSKSSRTAR